jgi:vancomycin permeability regulator SanA
VKGSAVVRRAALALALCTVAAAGTVLAVDARVASIGDRSIRPPTCMTFDCILVPGALVYGDVPSAMLQDRLDAAVEWYEAGRSDRILVSGDHGRDGYDEVNAMRAYLEAAGIPPEDIFLDHAGFDTYDSVYRARDVFQVRSALIVTQRFHLLRALYIADRLGVEAVGYETDRRTYGREAWYRIREYLARCKAFLDCEVTHARPTYLGDPIPISGSGLATRD